ncbi:hypothetical protein L218DRAFT_1006826 [Marasmius fiardii PR-910]|nr:hypothetical protein L218DRAFT_1006826 [Marasmius fiardii PR-910]
MLKQHSRWKGDLSKLRAIFAVPKEKDPKLFGTAFIYQTTRSEWSPPIYNEHMWAGDRVIPWPIDFGLNNAVKMFREAGYTQFLNVTLRWPLSFDGGEPYYIFGTPDGFVYVRVYTHKDPWCSEDS